MLRPRQALAGGVALAAALGVTGCGTHTAARTVQAPAPAPAPATTAVPVTTAAPPTTAAPAPATTTAPAPPTTVPAPPPTTTPAPAFPAVVSAAVATFSPRPAGLEAPIAVPAAPAAISAQASGLGGTDSVTLIATPTALPVNDPSLTAGAGTADLGTFSTTATATASGAASYLAAGAAHDLASCGGPATPAAIGVPGATSCPTVVGGVVDWTDGAWSVQVENLGAPGAPLPAAADLASAIRSEGLPAAGRGIISVVVPATSADGAATTASVQWQQGADVYQVRTSRGAGPTLYLADAMRPYTGG